MFHVEQFVAVEDSRVTGMTYRRCCAGSEHDEKCSTWNIPHDREQLGSVLFALFHVEQIEAGGKGLSLVSIEFPAVPCFQCGLDHQGSFLTSTSPGRYVVFHVEHSGRMNQAKDNPEPSDEDEEYDDLGGSRRPTDNKTFILFILQTIPKLASP